MEVYCLRCKDKVVPVSPKKEKFDNGATALRGTCPHCQGKVYRILTGPTKKK